MRARLALFAKLRLWIPDAVQWHEHHANAVLVGDREELIDAAQKCFVILFPKQVVQVDTNTIEADVRGPAEFAVDCFRIERIGLPQLKLIDSRAGREVAADQPRLLRIPGVDLLDGPSLASGGVAANKERKDGDKRQKSNELSFHGFFP